MDTKEFNNRKKFSEGSGSIALVDDRIKMRLNEFGIYTESLEGESIFDLDEKVEFVSPNLNSKISENDITDRLYGKNDGILHDDRLGYFSSLYVGHVVEGNYREIASSGGMGTWIFKELFENDLIDAVIHVKQNKDKSDPVLFKYDISRSYEEIKEGAKTKYYPVEFSEVLKTVKEVPGRYAIVGIPSFIMAVRLLQESDEVLKSRIKFTVGLICGHQKSSKFSEYMAWQVGIKPGNLRYIDFRKKLLDRPSNRYAVEMQGYKDGELVTIVKPTSELLGQNWGQGYFKVYASDFTDDVFNETADITLGDAWLPQYTNDSMGNNVVIIRNQKIDELVKEAIASGKLKMDTVDKEIIFDSQASHYRHTHDELAYRLFKLEKLNNWFPSKRVKPSNKISLSRRLVQDLREKISKQSHILYITAVEKDDIEILNNGLSELTRKYNFVYRFISLSNLGIKGILKKVLSRIMQ